LRLKASHSGGFFIVSTEDFATLLLAFDQ